MILLIVIVMIAYLLSLLKKHLKSMAFGCYRITVSKQRKVKLKNSPHQEAIVMENIQNTQ